MRRSSSCTTASTSESGAAEGVLLGLVNVTDSMEGLQLGLFNMTDSMNGLQIGLINVIKSKGTLPVFPIVNWSF